MDRDTAALAIVCPACNAAIGQPCTQPTNVGRRVVPWVHNARHDGVHIIHFGPENLMPDGHHHIRAACGVQYLDPKDTFTEDPEQVTCLRCRGTRKFAAEGGALIA